MPPRVSVIIPTYNRSAMIVKAVDSVNGQTFRDVEVIVVDDGSTDGTKKRLDACRHPVRYIRTEHRGPAAARNAGMRVASGEYIAFLDSDDLYDEDKLALQSHVLDRFPSVAMVYTECAAFDDSGRWDEFHLQDYHESAYRRGGLTYEKIFTEKRTLRELLGSEPQFRRVLERWPGRFGYFGNIFDSYLLNTVVFTNSMMFRSRLLPDVGYQKESFRLFEEMEFALRICRRNRVAFLDLPVYALRYHSGQISTTATAEGWRTRINKQRYLLKAVKQHALADVKYYEAHKEAIGRQLAGLYRAVAVPLLAHESKERHARRYYPRRARRYLRKCSQEGGSCRLLQALTFTPGPVRRVVFGVLHRLERIRKHGAVQSAKLC